MNKRRETAGAFGGPAGGSLSTYTGWEPTLLPLRTVEKQVVASRELVYHLKKGGFSPGQRGLPGCE